jgi:tRNA-specific 2-thiouridylase
LYVLNVLPNNNVIELGREHELESTTLSAHSVNLQKYAELRDPRRFLVKIRYKDEGAMATCSTDEDGILRIAFDEPRKAVAPGQSVVMYEGNDVVGGGIIRDSN